VAQLVTYAESGYGNGKAAADCSAHPGTCRSVYYFAPNLVYNSVRCPMYPSSEIIAAASESWYIHDAGYTDAAHRVSSTYNESCDGATISVPVWRINDSVAGVQQWWSNELQTYADGYDLYFMDNTHANVVNQYYACLPYPSYCYTTQEMPDDAAVVAGHASFVNALNHQDGRPMQFVFNSLNFDGKTVSPGVALFAASPRFVGASCESCAVYEGTYYPQNYARILNTMAAVNTTQGFFVLLSKDSTAAGSSAQIAERLLTTALVWLGYSEGHTVVWPDLEQQTQGLAVWPEDLIYPSAPLETMSSGAADLQVAPGVYRREFTTCYLAGTSFGHCAAIVNANATSVTVQASWLSQNYGHVIGVAGGDVLSGGSVSVYGQPFVPGSTAIPAYQAIILGS
jgi:hypothetical protein